MSVVAGAATRTINCEIGDDLCGQLHRRFCRRIRDDLEANFLYVCGGRESILLVSLDLLGVFDNAWVRGVTGAIEAQTGVPSRRVIITSTHTHAGPDTFGFLHDAPKNEAYLDRLEGWLVEGAAEAVDQARGAKLGWALGHAHVGYNRRLCWQDGTHSMYGDSQRADFTGIEGPDDPAHAVLFAQDADGNPIAIVHNNCCHATCMESEDYATADFPGEARRIIRGALGSPVPILYLQGASGDTSPWNMLKPRYRYPGTERVAEVGALLAGETLRLMRDAPLCDAPALGHAYQDLTIGVRLPTDEELDRARKVQSLGEEGAKRWQYVLSVCGVVRLYEDFKDHPQDTLAVHAVRIGDVAIATNPCELYCQFGLDIKRRSPGAVTMVAQLADGFSGYCPTIYGQMGGGYSGDAIYWTRLEARAGYKLVESSAGLLNRLWREPS